MPEPIPLSAPDVTVEERQAVDAVLSGRNLSLGPLLPAFENAMARVAGTRFAVAVNSGTSALHLAVKAAGIGAGDEVITTPFSFIASANCILFENGTPRFVDINPHTYNLDAAAIEAAITPKTKAILPVHVFGHPCDMQAINKVAERHNLAVIEDSCEAIGASIHGRPAGSFGTSAAFAFYPNKQITTGEGGALVTNCEQTARLARSWRNQGRAEGGAWLAHERLGYNYRLSDINCALGLGQVERLDQILAARRKVAKSYTDALSGIPELVLPPVPAEGLEMSWFVYVVRLHDDFDRQSRDAVMESLRQQGVACNNYFAPIHLQPFYRDTFGYQAGDFPITEATGDRTIALPFFNRLSPQQIERVAASLRRAFHQVRRSRPVVSFAAAAGR